MRVKSIYLENVRGLPTIALDFFDPITGQVRTRTVIAGSNGAGKTTILDTIYTLAKLVVSQMDNSSLSWLASGPERAKLELHDMPALHDPGGKTVPGGWPLVVAVGSESWLAQIDAPNLRMFTGPYCVDRTPGNIVPLTVAITERWETTKLPTTLYFPSEQRELAAKEKGQIIAEGSEHKWTWRFSDSQKWEGSLESFLVAMDYRDLMSQRERQTNTGEFLPFLKVINRFLKGKQIIEVDQSSFRVQVRADSGKEFSIDKLSSGEKQILLMLGEIQRRISKGSIVMIDEPEIHLHPRWQRLLVRTLTDLCAMHDAQLIITTHSEEIANAVYEHELILLDAIFNQESAI
ncbi:MAG: AAA family ATPase [Chloroflexota bacterium]|nr:AAA family ATPase [Chloroflexota bacterium]